MLRHPRYTNNNPAQRVYAETILENPKETDDALNVDPLRRNRRLFVFVQISFCFESVEDVEQVESCEVSSED